jgi:hypothetical protein
VWALVRAAGSAQDAALFLTAAFTGLRMGELLALQWRDVNFSGQAIRVRRSYNIHGGLGTPKSGKVRSVPMVPEVARALAALGAREEFVGDEELVFPNDLGRFQDARPDGRSGDGSEVPSEKRAGRPERGLVIASRRLHCGSRYNSGQLAIAEQPQRLPSTFPRGGALPCHVARFSPRAAFQSGLPLWCSRSQRS